MTLTSSVGQRWFGAFRFFHFLGKFFVLSYLAQFAPPPPELNKLDLYVQASRLHFLSGAL